MKQQPDKLFSDKLASYSRPAPTRAWDAIEAGLDKRSHKGLWLKLAASLLLLATTTYVLWQVYGSQKGEPARNLATTTPAVQAPVVRDSAAHNTTIATTPAVQNTPAEASHTKEAAPQLAAHQRTKQEQQERVAPAQSVAEQTTVAIADNNNTNAVHTTVTTPDAVTEQAAVIDTHTTADAHATSAIASNTSAETDKNITLVYSAREADGYLDKKGLAEATSVDEKPSTLKKLLKKAADLKSNQDPLGELRQRKNEILALNFRSEKQRGQNK